MKPIIPLCLFLLSACQSPPEKILKDLNKANDVLGDFNRTIVKRDSLALKTVTTKSALLTLYLHIQSNQGKDPRLAAKADSTGERTAPAEQLLLHTRTSDRIKAHLMKVDRYGYRNSNSALHDICTRKGDWATYYFKETPTVAALTILSLLQSNCDSTAFIGLKDIDSHF
jgi:hypothetical protein